MPEFRRPTGEVCTADEAHSGGRLRPGYREILLDGEYAHFGLAFRDSAPRSVFLTDSSAASFTDAERGLIIAKARADHHTSTAYLGDRAPAFTDAMATQALTAEANARQRNSAVIGQVMADAAVLHAAEVTAATKAANALNDWRRG